MSGLALRVDVVGLVLREEVMGLVLRVDAFCCSRSDCCCARFPGSRLGWWVRSWRWLIGPVRPSGRWAYSTLQVERPMRIRPRSTRAFAMAAVCMVRNANRSL